MQPGLLSRAGALPADKLAFLASACLGVLFSDQLGVSHTGSPSESAPPGHADSWIYLGGTRSFPL